MDSDIKVTNLEYYKVGTGDCEVYLGTVKLYPLGTPQYDTQYLTVRALSNGSVRWSGTTSGSASNTLSYSTDSGATWSSPSADVTVNVSSGDTIMWKGYCTPYSTTFGIGVFVVGALIDLEVEGNIMSLLYGDNFSGQTSLSGKDYVFSRLFTTCSKLKSSSNLVLPATTLSNGCYYGMFEGCGSLTTAPTLPATTLTYGCYEHMFFTCRALEVAPALPATTLAERCYDSMFNGCTSLEVAPSLPATTLANSCYFAMFNGCVSLTTAPVLSATTLVDGCYWVMFQGCSGLTAITCLATDISAYICTANWVDGVAPTGVFTKDPNMTSWTIDSVHGVPIGWTVQDYT